ncbi:helix-turn-helix domain-containing protein [Actinomadura decatromicini]|uniref:Helix-turn-helix transcriptional regulator n=1 Tax=Actinomadura decatromicini TaxID=2604572 RepID=A0A5D3FGH4_9ACTN|nr:helix-turn-helix transcriptional regulator [Actinomadura decatromicini]TYK47189.1 helix-turn-helix transcriptional regulator [Actinomadura decatromicini]
MTSSDKGSTSDDAGRWLREQRERRGIRSQAELARLLGWDKTAVNNYETRGTKMPNDRAKQIADFFHLDVITVRRNLGLWVPDDDASAMDNAERQLDENEQLAADIRSLAESDRQAVTAIVESLKKNAETRAREGEGNG